MLVAVTGASRGFGRLLASAFAVLPVTSMKLVRLLHGARPVAHPRPVHLRSSFLAQALTYPTQFVTSKW